MDSCTSTILSKVSETVGCIFDSCMPPKIIEESQASQYANTFKGDDGRKEELKQLVGIFAARAQKYIPCTRIQLETETFKKAQYRLDSNLETLTIETEGTTVHIPISQVKAVYGYDDIKPEDSPELLLHDIFKNMDEDQRDRLAIIEYNKNGRDAQMILMEHEIQTSDPLITVLRILNIYATTRQ
ncbi:hypothetical protein X943_002552 [Babesia divergens]|uniref:Uncharacterized protein n=1 Tax=Babesia divergens TaxID=32595 RepID=A0AAD9LJC7_BABDI|nr:hypothetical protein X943_002552 [Babesia divergens]